MKAKTSIERMRSYIFSNITHPHFVPMNVMLDEIEAHYMRLPVDADGVQIRPGDEMQMALGESAEVVAVDSERWFYDQSCLADDDEEYEWAWAQNSRHVKNNTVEDKFNTVEELLKELMHETVEWCHYSGPMSGTRTQPEIIADYAERIRNVVYSSEDITSTCDVVTNPLSDESGFRSCLWVEEDEYNRLKEERDELRAEVMNLGEKLDRLRRDDKDYNAVAVKACNLKASLT